ncbi:hypothetical protein VTK56DRAFT_2397 [Thermocarpiscus australiensis]
MKGQKGFEDTDNARWGSVFRGLGRLVRPSFPWLVLALFAAVIIGGTFSGSGLIFGFTVGALNPCSNSPDRISTSARSSGACFSRWPSSSCWPTSSPGPASASSPSASCTPCACSHSGRSWSRACSGTSPRAAPPPRCWTSSLRTSAAIGGFSSSTVCTVVSIVVNFITAIILSHIIMWKIAVVCLAVMPVLLGAGFMQLRMLARYEERHAASFSQATGMAVEAVQSIKTVAALSLEKEVMGSYARLLKNTRDEMVRAAAFTNVWLALSNSMSFLIYAFAYWLGSQRIMHSEADQTQFFIILVAMLVSAQLWGQMYTLAPEFLRARTSFARILAIIGLGSDNAIDSKHGPHSPSQPGLDQDDIEALAESNPSSRPQPARHARHLRRRVLCLPLSPTRPRPPLPLLHHPPGPVHRPSRPLRRRQIHHHEPGPAALHPPPTSGTILLGGIPITSSSHPRSRPTGPRPSSTAASPSTSGWALPPRPGGNPIRRSRSRAGLAGIHDVTASPSCRTGTTRRLRARRGQAVGGAAAAGWRSRGRGCCCCCWTRAPVH